jgi:hypothetical protein
MNAKTIELAPIADRAELKLRLGELHTLAAREHPQGADGPYLALAQRFESQARPVRHALLCSPLAWTEDEKREARWLQRTCDDLAAIGYRLSESVAPRLGVDDGSARALVATTLFYMGETVKWDLALAPDAPHDMRKVHNLMRLARQAGRHHTPMRFTVDGAESGCTLESLYFRVLLLARFSSGTLNSQQIEILDAWMWMWMPVLTGVSEPPPGTALRADLDTASGLQLGPREGPGESLYLPHEPIEAAYREVVAQFHAGHVVPATGIASEFRIEQHVAVLALVRRNLRHSKRAPVGRAPRRAADRLVDLFVGLGEIVKYGFLPPAPVAAGLSLANGAVPAAPRHSDRHLAFDGIYDADRRQVRLIDESDTGLGFEGSSAGCGAIAAGDLVAVRLAPGECLIFGKVVRSVPSKRPGRIILGVRRLSSAAQVLEAERNGKRTNIDEKVVFVAGMDSNGRQDACMVTERDFDERSRMEVVVDGRKFRLRLNRARERGRGWVLAGFEVASARGVDPIEAA